LRRVLGRAAPLLAFALLLGAQDEEEPVVDQAPWFAPWRAVDVRTADDATKAWAMVREFFGNMREGHAHEVWERDAEEMPPARPLEECLAALQETGQEFPRMDQACHMSAQVRVAEPVEGVTFSSSHEQPAEPLDVGCELALRLPRLAQVLREFGVKQVVVGAPARFSLRSYHRFGLALDVYALGFDDGTELVVEDDYVRQSGRETCEGDEPGTSGGKLLRDIACRLFESRVLSTVITPNYNDGHRDHFHWDVRPGDERFYLR
jgi:hypothetical protein